MLCVDARRRFCSRYACYGRHSFMDSLGDSAPQTSWAREYYASGHGVNVVRGAHRGSTSLRTGVVYRIIPIALFPYTGGYRAVCQEPCRLWKLLRCLRPRVSDGFHLVTGPGRGHPTTALRR